MINSKQHDCTMSSPPLNNNDFQKAHPYNNNNNNYFTNDSPYNHCPSHNSQQQSTSAFNRATNNSKGFPSPSFSNPYEHQQSPMMASTSDTQYPAFDWFPYPNNNNSYTNSRKSSSASIHNNQTDRCETPPSILTTSLLPSKRARSPTTTTTVIKPTPLPTSMQKNRSSSPMASSSANLLMDAIQHYLTKMATGNSNNSPNAGGGSMNPNQLFEPTTTAAKSTAQQQADIEANAKRHAEFLNYYNVGNKSKTARRSLVTPPEQISYNSNSNGYYNQAEESNERANYQHPHLNRETAAFAQSATATTMQTANAEHTENNALGYAHGEVDSSRFSGQKSKDWCLNSHPRLLSALLNKSSQKSGLSAAAAAHLYQQHSQQLRNQNEPSR
jgi:hypothetical protein